MKKKLQIFKSIALGLFMFFFFNLNAQTIIQQGSCGDNGNNLTYQLTSDSVMTISGSGAMANYFSGLQIPWYANKDGIKTLIIGDSVTSVGAFSFVRCTNLSSASIGSSVLTIEDEAFWGTNLSSITIPNSVISIGNYAFSMCQNLASVSLPNSLTTMGISSFYETALSSIVIPNSVASIGDYSFMNCVNLSSVTLGNSITNIGNRVFDSCINLTSINIPNSVTRIGDAAFQYCPFTSINLPNAITQIGRNAFYMCENLSSVTLPDSITKIDISTFLGTALTSIIIPDQVEIIDDFAFYNCSNLTSIDIPPSVTTIGYAAFSDCYSLVSVNLQGSLTSIENYVFNRCFSLTSIDIPPSVTTIGDAAFSENISLTSISIPPTVSSIGGLGFDSCINLTKITSYAITPPMIESNSSIHTFRYVPNNIPIIIPNGSLAAYQASAWGSYFTNFIDTAQAIIQQGYCGIDGNNLTFVLTSDSVLTISGSGAMANYYPSYLVNLTPEYEVSPWRLNRYKIKTLVVGDSVTTIGSYALAMDYNNLSSINIGNSVVSIEMCAFQFCESLVSVNTPNSVVNIENGAFGSCQNLTTVIIGDSVRKIGDGAFGSCPNLTTVIMGSSVETIGNGAFGNTGITSIIIPNSTLRIDAAAFSYCESLESVIIGNSVDTIEYRAFENCTSLSSLTIGSSVSDIGWSAFSDCTNLSTIICKAIIPPIFYNNGNHVEGGTFYNIPSNANVYIPCGTLLAYDSSEWAVVFTNIIIDGVVSDTTVYNKTTCHGSPYSDDNFSNLNETGTYHITLWNIHDCDSVIKLNLMVKDIPLPQEICMVTVDNENHNNIVWKKNEEVVSYNIYRESNQSGQYDLIATRLYSEPNSYIDTNSNAKIRSYRYKVSAIDTCENESEDNIIHKTMHLTINAGQDNTWNLIWTPYEGMDFQTYNIYRASSASSEDYQLIGTMPNGNSSYSDFTAPSGYVYYYVEIVLDSPCIFNKSGAFIKSNIATNDPNVSLNSITKDTFISLYPNPASNMTTITINGVDSKAYISIIDMHGRIIASVEKNPSSNKIMYMLDLGGFATGVYYIRVDTDNKIKTQKLIIQ